MRPQLRVLSVLAVIAPLFFGANMPARAATFTVSSTDDDVDTAPGNGVCADSSGPCTLRAAIMETNALDGADAINLPVGIYNLTIPGIGEDASATGDLDITGDLIINGAGAASTTIQQVASDRVLHFLAGTVTISGVTITGGNSVTTGGIGIANQGTLTLNSSTISGNTATLGTQPVGGGIANDGTLTINGSTVSRNSTTVGGGIFNSGILTLNNTTVSGNTSTSAGGGIFNINGSITLNSSTITGNSAPAGFGGGIWQAGSGTERNTIVANNSSGGNCTAGGIGTSLGHNLSSDASCAFAGPGDLNGYNPLLGPLASNGGPTQTHALLPGSPAIDAVPLASCTVSTDQRGVARPQGAACDIGAYEAPACVQPPPGMVAWWPFDETTGTVVHDIWTHHLDGMPIPSPVGFFPGPYSLLGEHVNNSLYFVASYVDVPFSALLSFFNGGAGAFSIDAWVKTSGAINGPLPNVIHPVVDKTVVLGSGVKGYALYLYAPVFQAPRLAFTLDDGTVPVTPSPPLLHPISLSPGWHHVAVTVGWSSPISAAVTLYVDGTPSPTATVAVGDTNNNADLWMGKSRVGSLLLASDATEFAIDEVEIFNGVLTPQDVLAIYTADSEGKCRTATRRPRYLPFR